MAKSKKNQEIFIVSQMIGMEDGQVLYGEPMAASTSHDTLLDKLQYEIRHGDGKSEQIYDFVEKTSYYYDADSDEYDEENDEQISDGWLAGDFDPDELDPEEIYYAYAIHSVELFKK